MTIYMSEREKMTMNEQLVVIIDDDEMLLTLAGAILTNEGYKVRTASDSAMANQYIFGELRPALILIDVMMPELQGDEIAKLLKENPDTSSIPILLMSGMSEEELDEMVLKTGVNGYLIKPFSFEELVEAVRKICNE